MPRPIRGSFDIVVLADDTSAFQLRFPVNGERARVILHERPLCTCGCGGGWTEQTARNELVNEIARVRAGVWKPRVPVFAVEPSDEPSEIPTFHEYASWWLQAKWDGTLSEKGGISDKTHRQLEGVLRNHILPVFGPYRLDEITKKMCEDFKGKLIREARELREAIAAGADIRDERRRRKKPLGLDQIRRIIRIVQTILDEAREDGHVVTNNARGRRMKLAVPKPRRTFLENDELAVLLDAAAEQDRPEGLAAVRAMKLGRTAQLVVRAVEHGLRSPSIIGAKIGRSKATVSYHLTKLGLRLRPYFGRRVVCEVLGRSGVRIGELQELRIGQVRVHDPDGARFDIPDAKTEAGVRKVEMSPELVEAVVEHIDMLRRLGFPTGPDAYLVPNERGGRVSQRKLRRMVREAALAASEYMVARGLPPLPHTTPHTLRRTYISCALVANNYDIEFVMSQVGHADHQVTMEVYNQLKQRIKRDHGRSLDKLVRAGRELVAQLPVREQTTADDDELAVMPQAA
ncbi:MAG TPA: site-specific integrase [Conexibacter sp.]|nr:site-specific integrase [Conexibacter sp.]